MKFAIIPLMIANSTLATYGLFTPDSQVSKNHLHGIEIRAENTATPYQRRHYQYGTDADRDGQNTRAELLISTSEVPVKFTAATQRTVKSGRWFDPYTGVTFKRASDVDIDHLVPLYEVHVSGGYGWSDEKKRAFANDLSEDGPLRVTHRWTNRIPKNADGPSDYSPSYVPGRCQYLYDWISIKRIWGLSMDPNEADAILTQIKACA